MNAEQAARCMVELSAAFPSVRLPRETIAVWRQWLEALPFVEAKRAVSLVCAQHDFPTVHQMIAACGISSEPVLAMLVAAKEGGFELVRDDTSKHGWRTSMDALPEPVNQGVPCPPEIKAEIREKLARLAAKRVAEGAERPEVKPDQLAAELAMADARFNAELARAQAAERGELSAEELIPY